MYVIAIYEIDRCYGGPEEGGWWVDSGDLRRIVRVTGSEESAYRIAGRVNGWLDRLQRDQRDVGSVLYCGGRYSAAVYRDVAPAFYPEERAHYE